MKKILFIAAIALLSGCKTAPQGVRERALELPGLVALWDFGGENGLKAVGSIGGLAVYDRALTDAEMLSLKL